MTYIADRRTHHPFYSLYGGLSQSVFISNLLICHGPVTCIQTWYYYGRYPSDPWHIKLLVSLPVFYHFRVNRALQVALVFVSDTCHQALISHTGMQNRPLSVYHT